MTYTNYDEILNTIYIEPEFQPVDIWDRYEREDGTVVKLYKHRPHYLDVTTSNPNKEEATWRYFWDEQQTMWLLENIIVVNYSDQYHYLIDFTNDNDKTMATGIRGHFEHYNNWIKVPWKKSLTQYEKIRDIAEQYKPNDISAKFTKH
tara:strand:+ start:704 stop:1147 length:444 start_codon:yes stop_codon:yes gene_type:complete